MPAPETVPGCAQAGVLGTVPGLLGVLQAHEALKLMLGIGEPLIGALLKVDLLTMRFQKLRLPRDPGCPLCGDSPTIRTLTETSFVCATPPDRPDDALPWISLAASAQRPTLRWVDVRSPAEFAAGHVPGAIHAPLADIEAWAAQERADAEWLLYCQQGGRTVQAYHRLQGRLHGPVLLLQGGYEAWLQHQATGSAVLTA